MSGRRGPAKRRRLSNRPIAFSPFFRSLSRVATVSKPKVSGDSALSSDSPGDQLADRPPSDAIERLESSDVDDDGGDLDGSDEEDEEPEETVQVDFGFFDPKPGDFHGVKLLLQHYLGDRPWDLSGFVDLILEQTTVGTVVKSESSDEEADGGGGGDDDDEGPYAVISALNLGRYASHRCIKELKQYLLEACVEETVGYKFRSLLGEERARDVGLLVSDRFVNFPSQPVPPLYDGLFDEVSWATEDEPTQEIRDFFRFKFYLMVTRIYMKKNAGQGEGRSEVPSTSKNKSSSKNRRRNCDDDQLIIYIKSEDEIFHKLCSLSFTFPFPRTEQLLPPELKNYKEMGLVMVVESNKVPMFRRELKSLLSES